MSKKILIASVLIVAVLGTLGGVGYMYYDAASNMEVEVENISLDNYSLHLLSLTVDVDISFDVNATSPSVSLKLDKVNFNVKVEGLDVGPGFIEDFTAVKESALSPGEIAATGLGLNYYNVFTSYVNGEDLDITITITSVVIFGMTIDFEYTTTETININD